MHFRARDLPLPAPPAIVTSVLHAVCEVALELSKSLLFLPRIKDEIRQQPQERSLAPARESDAQPPVRLLRSTIHAL